MLRQLALTAERTMTRAGNVNGSLDEEAAIRERPPLGKSIGGRFDDRVRYIHVSGLLHAAPGRWP